MIGVFGTWRSAGPVSLDGVEGPHDGWLLIIFALIALAGVRSLSRHGWLGIVTVLGAACAMLYTAIGNLLDDRAVLGGKCGLGVVVEHRGVGCPRLLRALGGVRPAAGP